MDSLEQNPGVSLASSLTPGTDWVMLETPHQSAQSDSRVALSRFLTANVFRTNRFPAAWRMDEYCEQCHLSELRPRSVECVARRWTRGRSHLYELRSQLDDDGLSAASWWSVSPFDRSTRGYNGSTVGTVSSFTSDSPDEKTLTESGHCDRTGTGSAVGSCPSCSSSRFCRALSSSSMLSRRFVLPSFDPARLRGLSHRSPSPHHDS